jgi:hypothetical protein
VIHQPLYRPKQIRAGEYAVGRKIGSERVNVTCGQTDADACAVGIILSC